MHDPLLRAFHAAMPAARGVVLARADGAVAAHDVADAPTAARLAALGLSRMLAGESALVAEPGGPVLVVRLP